MNGRAKPDRDREIAHAQRLMRAWRRAHREELDGVLAGKHGPMVERLMYLLRPAALAEGSDVLIAYARAIAWTEIDDTTKAIMLHEIGRAITALERQGLPPFSDPPPGEPENVFRLIKHCLFPARAAPPGA